jgi:phosphoribosylformylglycinamidine synthase subunit PurSL
MPGSTLNTPVYRYVCEDRQPDNPRSAGFLQDAHALGFRQITALYCKDLYFIKGSLSSDEQEILGQKLLADPISQKFACTTYIPKTNNQIVEYASDHCTVEVALLPGVTDDVAMQIKRAAHVLTIHTVEEVSTGLHFDIEGSNLTEDTIQSLIKRLLSNTVIQRAAIGEITPYFPDLPSASGEVELISVLHADDEELLRISADRRAALDLAEMQAIQQYFQGLKREPTDIEFEMIAQTWSEHCVHKTFAAKVTVQEADGTVSEIDHLLKTYLRSATEKINAPWVLSAFVDNAGILALDGDYEISFKVETHNHPSAIEPFGGANTGIGGVIRDVIGVSAKPIAATDILCFGPQNLPVEELAEGVLHPRRVQSGVVAGIEDYGNKIGIPTVNGAVLYDEGYTSNPLVYCGCIGLAPRNMHPCSPTKGDKIVVLGGATGRDGLRGATFSSMTMDAQTGEVSGASVQIGAPIVEKGLIDVLMKARDAHLYTAITDCGAGGLSSAIGEMVKHHGATIDLDKAPLKYPGLAPWEIWLSEAQERMVIAVPKENLEQLQKICLLHEVDCTILGDINADRQLNITYTGKTVLSLSLDFLHDGIPQRHLLAEIPHKELISSIVDLAISPEKIKNTTLALLAHPNIASKEAIVRVYDHEIMGGTAVKPLVGVQHHGPSDASVIKPIGTKTQAGFVLSNGINPWYGEVDAYNMAFAVIDEAVRNAVAVGADPDKIAILDNFCWGDPTNPQTMGSLVQALRGCYDAAIEYGTPFISGKDSLNNEYLGNDGRKHAIPPTLLISAMGVIPDVNKTITMDLKTPGNSLYLMGELQNCFGGSHYGKVTGVTLNNQVAKVPDYAHSLYRAVYKQIQAGNIQACHDLSEGGLIVAAAEMCLAGELGLEISSSETDIINFLFSETTACLLVEIAPQNEAAFQAALRDVPFTKIGTVQAAPVLAIQSPGMEPITLSLDEIMKAWLRSEQ